jgi:sugar phosphate isomerase/epimerase
VAELDAAAKKHGFRVGMHTHIDRLEQLDPAIALAKKVGTPYVDVMTGPYYVGEEETVRLLHALTQRFTAEKIAMMLQTHRGLVTQDVLRTVSYAKQIPDLRFDLDLSHYVAAGELGGDFPPAATEAFDGPGRGCSTAGSRTASRSRSTSGPRATPPTPGASRPSGRRRWRAG